MVKTHRQKLEVTWGNCFRG